MRFKSLLVFALLALAATPAYATVILHLTLAQKAADAEAIVHGKVVSQSTLEEEGKIHTYTAIEVKEWLKGDGEPEIKIRQLGGTLNGITQKIAGDASFKIGEEVVLFLRPRGAYFTLTGLSQSKYAVIKDDKEQKRVLLNNSGVSLVEAPQGGDVALKKVPQERLYKGEPADKFFERLNEILNEPPVPLPPAYIKHKKP